MDFVEHLNGDAGYQTLLSMPSGDLSVLCRTCKATRLRATAFLYRHVELLFRIFRPAGRSREGELDNFTDCHRRQHLFCETILARPDLAPFIQELFWTIDIPVLPDHPLKPWEWPFSFESPIDPLQSARPDQIWQTFLLLENVKVLDLHIHDYSIHGTKPSPFSTAPSSLFPKAHTVKLAGTCSVEFAKVVISHNTARIRHLAIDHLKFLGWSTLAKSALPTLTSLTFRKTGAFSRDEPFDAIGERAAFTELATALESTRRSIRLICIGSTLPRRCVMYCIIPDQKPVSQAHFEELVVPTLIRGYWPNLETLTLQGLELPFGLKHNIPSVVYEAGGISPGI